MSCRRFGTPIIQLSLLADKFWDRFSWKNFQGFAAVAEESDDEASASLKEDPQMERLVDNISELASKVLEIFGEKSFSFDFTTVLWSKENFFSFPEEPIAAKASSDELQDNTYFVSFLLRDRRNKTIEIDKNTPRQRMIVNNNFNGEKLGTSQVYVESGQPPKQPPAHNVQLLNGSGPQAPQNNGWKHSINSDLSYWRNEN